MKRLETIKDKSIFNNLIRNGHYDKNNYFVVYSEINDTDYTKFGIAISNKVGKANIRNKLKRQTRAIIDKNRILFKKGHNYIIMIRKDCKDSNFKELEQSIIDLLKKG